VIGQGGDRQIDQWEMIPRRVVDGFRLNRKLAAKQVTLLCGIKLICVSAMPYIFGNECG